MKLLWATLLVVVSVLGVTCAGAEQPSECKGVLLKGAGVLKQCGDRLQLWNLKPLDERWRAGQDLHGRFSFECFILPSKRPPDVTIYDMLRSQAATGDMPRCPDQLSVGGFFFDAGEWQKGPKDENAIQAALFQMPLGSGVWTNELKHSIRSICPAFDITIGGVNARAACFELSDLKQNMIAMAVVDEDTSLVLTFLKDDLTADALKSSFLDFVRLLTIERASGDAALLRWLQ